MTIPEGPVLEEIVAGVDLVERLGHIRALVARHQELLALIMDLLSPFQDQENTM